MARYLYNGEEIEAIPTEEWTVGELSEAEHAIGVSLDGSSVGDAMAIAFYISARRVDKETHRALLGDAAKRVKMSDLIEKEEEAAPLEEASHVAPQTSGRQDSEATESLSLSRT